jgi:hypothetical protein
MISNTQKIIEDIITESALDSRIPDGIVNLHNSEHIAVIAERMHDSKINEEIINEFVETFMDEGKYPERQAYNKDGWLVTFPSGEYKQRAIKKGTHYGSDPTHGKGGMNLYYKSRGKQKRQTQQAVSSTDTEKQQLAAKLGKQNPQPPASRVQQEPPKQTPAADTSAAAPSGDNNQEQEFDRLSGGDDDDIASPEAVGDKQSTKKDTENAPQAARAPAPAPAPVPEIAKPHYEEISKKFVAQKGWMPTPFGEYRDTQGNVVAVVGLSGEIVSIKNNDREEYKLFAEKNMPQRP